MELLNSYEEACEIENIDPAENIPFADPKNGDQLALNSLARIFIGVRAINRQANGGKPWTPDWKNSRQWKYEIIMNMSSGSGLSYYDCDYVDSYSGVGSRLCFISEDVAEHFFEAFKPEFENFAIVK